MRRDDVNVDWVFTSNNFHKYVQHIHIYIYIGLDINVGALIGLSHVQ